MKRFVTLMLCLSLLLSLGAVGVSAEISANVTEASFAAVEFKTVLIQTGGDLYSDINEDYWEYWWEDEVPELDNWFQACTINMRGFSMSADGRYMYMGTLNGGTGVRGVVVYDTQKAVVTDLYYHYDGDSGLSGSPFSYAKGIAADDRGYVYVGYAFSKNYNVVNLGIAKQLEDGTLEEVAFEAAYAFGNPGDEGGIHVGVNGVDVAKIGDKYYCYVMTNYDYDALYCYDVTDPENPTLNKDFGTNGCITFSEPSNTVAGSGFTLKEGQYMDVDDDGTIWLVVNSNEGTDGVMKIAPDGSACGGVAEAAGIYCVEHEGGFLLCGKKDGSAIVVLDDASFETIATVAIPEDFGDRITRIQIINDVLIVCDAGNDDNTYNAIHMAALSADGQAFLDTYVDNLNKAVSGAEETTAPDADTPDESAEETTAATTDEVTQASADDTQATTDAPVEGTDAATETQPEKSGCGATVGMAALAVLLAAAFVARKKD